MVLKKYGVAIKKYANRTADRIACPTPAPGASLKTGKYRTLDIDGICLPGENLQPGVCVDHEGCLVVCVCVPVFVF